jgi:AcrR family transcriptional regulator
MFIPMKSGVTRPYRQTARARAAEERTERILGAALDLYAESSLDQLTLAAVAERAGVGLQTVIRRVGTKDGLVAAVNAWIGPQVERLLGPPPAGDPDEVAAATGRVYERWGAVIGRSLLEEHASAERRAAAEAGRAAHRQWVSAAFADHLFALPPAPRRTVRAQLVALTGVELWLVLARDEGLSGKDTRAVVADLIRSVLGTTTSRKATPR